MLSTISTTKARHSANIGIHAARREVYVRVEHILGEVVDQTDGFADTDDPIADLRAVAIALFAAVVERPWLGRYLMRDNGTQPNGVRMYEELGRHVMRLGLSPRDTFHGVSAVLGFVIGTATDLGQQVPAEVRDGTVSGEELIARAADQFRAGLDLVLAGLRLQADA
ncbi:TetR/AcrR family transcriptional regulator C-terminal domain-containing protein [Gordonia liuliyuniae]|uniref:TetR/AcrR family transcriptional regulator C-terminal domain-containing protein n=1 Tax=Gordonia liuliyuniae TaxID=2911517 RepID=UPI003556B8A1